MKNINKNEYVYRNVHIYGERQNVYIYITQQRDI